MFTSKPRNSKRAFTLIEILIVVAILGLLMGITTQMLSTVGQSQGKSRAKADMAVMASALEAFAAQYGGYPRFNVAKRAGDAGEVYKCLTGKMVLRVKDNTITMSTLSSPRKAFVDVLKFRLIDPSDKDAQSVDSSKEGVCLADPWDEPYMYLYNTDTTAGTLESEWKSPSFVLFTKGPDTMAKDVRNMYSTGIIPANDIYTEPEENIDNIIHGRTE